MKIGDDASLFRETYYRLYNYKNGKNLGAVQSVRFDGGEDNFGRVYKPVWPRLAKKLTDKRIDIVAYLEDVFDVCTIRMPQDAVKDNVIQDYLDRASNDDHVRRVWDMEDIVLSRAVKLRRILGDSKDRAVMVTVLDQNLDVSPLTRYLFALLNGVESYLTEEDAMEAFNQYNRRRSAYDKWCGDRIPEGWKKK